MPLLSKVKEELSRMEEMQIISAVDEPTEWCSGLVVVPKPSGDVRLCVDLTQLNNSILREFHPVPSGDHTLAQLSGAKYFSKLDANSGFWQVGLSPDSDKLTNFRTSFGRFCFNRLPFGISSAPEHFQKRMNQVLEGTQGFLKEHDQNLDNTFQKLLEANLTLNKDRCEFQGRIQPTNLTVPQPTNLTVSPEVGPHPNTNSNTNRQKSDRVPSNAGQPLDPPLNLPKLQSSLWAAELTLRKLRLFCK